MFHANFDEKTAKITSTFRWTQGYWLPALALTLQSNFAKIVIFETIFNNNPTPSLFHSNVECLASTRREKELEKDERINLRVIFTLIIAFLQKQWTMLLPFPDAYFNYLNTSKFLRWQKNEIKWQKSTPVEQLHTRCRRNKRKGVWTEKWKKIFMHIDEGEKGRGREGPLSVNPFSSKVEKFTYRDDFKTCRKITINFDQFIHSFICRVEKKTEKTSTILML